MMSNFYKVERDPITKNLDDRSIIHFYLKLRMLIFRALKIYSSRHTLSKSHDVASFLNSVKLIFMNEKSLKVQKLLKSFLFKSFFNEYIKVLLKDDAFLNSYCAIHFYDFERYFDLQKMIAL